MKRCNSIRGLRRKRGPNLCRRSRRVRVSSSVVGRAFRPATIERTRLKPELRNAANGSETQWREAEPRIEGGRALLVLCFVLLAGTMWVAMAVQVLRVCCGFLLSWLHLGW